MRPVVVIALVVVLAGALVGVFVMRNVHAPAPHQPVSPPMVSRPAPPPLAPERSSASADVERVRQALQAALRRAAEQPASSAFPEGTRLIDVRLQGDLAIVDLSQEFGNLANQGDTAESMAQHALRSVLASCPGVKRMRVLLQGKQFEGEHSGPWDDVPVQDEPGSRS